MFFYFVEIDSQVMRIGIGTAFLLVVKLPDRVGKVVIAHIGECENGVSVILLNGYGLPTHLFLHRFGANFLGSSVGIIFCPVRLYLCGKVSQADFGIVVLSLVSGVHRNELKGIVRNMTAHGIINVAVSKACTLGFYFGKGILVCNLQNIRYGIAKLHHVGSNFQIIIDRSAGLCQRTENRTGQHEQNQNRQQQDCNGNDQYFLAILHRSFSSSPGGTALHSRLRDFGKFGRIVKCC